MIQGEWIETLLNRHLNDLFHLNLSLMIQGEWIETLIVSLTVAYYTHLSLMIQGEWIETFHTLKH